MNLPKVIDDLLKAQDTYDSIAYSSCFSEAAVVFDEGKKHKGRIEIESWIAKANEEYKTVMKPLLYDETKSILAAEISGNFPGSPIILKYHFEIVDGLIQSLKTTD